MIIDQFQKILPAITDFNRPYWDGCSEGQLRLQKCQRCDHMWFPEGPCCPSCLSTDHRWTPVSGRGEVWSHIRMHQKYFAAYADEIPYIVIMVKLDEGPRMYSALTADSPPPVVGARVDAVFEKVGDRSIPKFRVVEKIGG